MLGAMEIRELVQKIVLALVDLPEKVRVQKVEGQRVTVLEIKVAKKDIGYLLGKAGKNIAAIRSIVSAAGKGKNYVVEIVEPDDT
jgi:predicted RNA-binding protein YlqC (UPF0109 family)